VSATSTLITGRHRAMPAVAASESATRNLCASCVSPPRGRVGAHLPVLPAIALALLPKCPLCLGAWFGFLGAFGVGPWLGSAWQMSLGLVFVSVALASLAIRACRSCDPRPLLLGTVGAAVLLWGRHGAEWFLLCGGLGLLIGASVWSSEFKLLSTVCQFENLRTSRRQMIGHSQNGRGRRLSQAIRAVLPGSQRVDPARTDTAQSQETP